SKAYRIYANPKDRLKEFLARGRRTYHQEFWALRDVSLQVPVGSTLGLIGDNGAGKSTLLQLVAGVLRPSSGEVTTRGRVSTILELGTGFNPEFTGRENAVMSGTILGIPPREMERLLPEIIDFAEIGDFFDRPVKIYSSGMYVRLAFAVATSVDPDVLIVDEALAVGDQHFQKRCIDRIERFRKSGKTILFCSHSLYLVNMVCDRAIWLRQGRVAETGDVSRVVAAYETYLRERESRKTPVAATRDGSRAFPWIAGVWLSRDEEDAPRDTFITGEELTVTVHYEVPQSPTIVHVGVSIERNDAVEVFATATHLADVKPASVSGSIRLHFPRLALMSGAYTLSVFLLDEHGLHVYDRRVRACTFFVEQLVQQLGLCYLEHQWEAGVAAIDGPQPFLQREPARL
ncbi:ABC transporter ATP-binding protein, partial [Candidatus Methylomirabilis sp.]|uniref:ABC transporter ATP-binding protein n=1 Tax=Candidatus Methylomirabilis sp. TaxID=2032687 RepID=UPI003C7514C3